MHWEINYTEEFWMFGPLVEENRNWFFFLKFVYFISFIPDWNSPFDWLSLRLFNPWRKRSQGEWGISTKRETFCEQLVFKYLSCMKHEEGTDGAAWVLLSAVLIVALAVKTMSHSLSYTRNSNFSKSICKSGTRCPCSESLWIPWYGCLSPESQVALVKWQIPNRYS